MTSVNFVNKKHIVGVNEFHFEWCPKYRYACMKKEYINKEVEKNSATNRRGTQYRHKTDCGGR